MKEVAPTYEEFYKEVKKEFWGDWDNLSEKEVDDYLHSEEEKIHRDYQSYLRRFNKGEIDRRTFMIGGVGAVGNCLILMY